MGDSDTEEGPKQGAAWWASPHKLGEKRTSYTVGEILGHKKEAPQQQSLAAKKEPTQESPSVDFGNIKNDWLFKIGASTLEEAKDKVRKLAATDPDFDPYSPESYVDIRQRIASVKKGPGLLEKVARKERPTTHSV